MKLGVCVPYRDREKHLKEFVPRVGKYLESQGIEYQMYFGHQVDDKLFNRGAMKNVAAEWAFKEGCDYIVYHDIDMIPEDDTCDYSYPKDNPRHIAVSISQSDYKLKYEEYFGGAVLFTKEQVQKTNGYSNDYWDWGMEDDDLFWRCVLEDYVDQTYLDVEFDDKKFLHFNGNNSYVEIKPNRTLRNLTHKPHTVSVLVRANQQTEKVPIYLIGDKDRRFCEYPILRRSGWDWGLSYNNSRAFTAMLWTNKKENLYQWMKRYERQWTWVTLSVDTENNKVYFYQNGDLSSARHGTGSDSPIDFDGRLKRYGSEPYLIGSTNSVPEGDVSKWFKGDIAKIMIFDEFSTESEVSTLHKKTLDDFGDELVLYYDFEKVKDNVVQDPRGIAPEGIIHNCDIQSDNIKVPNTALPYRVDGRFECLPHPKEGLIDEGDGVMKWAKGETTARNERRYILQMQTGNWDYKNDGMNSLEYELVDTTEINDKAKLINVKL